MVTSSNPEQYTVGLFITCAVDLFRPSVGFCAVKLLEEAGYQVVVPPQSCCGQVAYNNGMPEQTKKLVQDVVKTFSEVDYVVAPSGSCASMLRNHYSSLFAHSNEAVNRFASKVYELTTFLTEVAPETTSNATPNSTTTAKTGSTTIAYHDSCAGLRELGIKNQPRKLIADLNGERVAEIDDGESCCGFGGTFCVKFADISNKIVSDKASSIRALKPDLLLGGDLTCLMNIAGKLQRQGDDTLDVRHVAEYLAADFETPAIGKKA